MNDIAKRLLDTVPRGDSKTIRASLITGGKTPAIPERKITERTARLYDYTAGAYKNYQAQIANYRDENGLTVAQHIRYGEKQFAWLGREKGLKIQLFGQHLGSDGTLILTEGELDAMSVYEVFHKHRGTTKFTVASIPDGAASAKKSCTDQLRWILGFKRVVIFMDQDEPGRKAASDLAALVGPTAAVVGAFPYKDANEALVADDPGAILEAINNARRQRPDAIVHAPDLLEKILNPEHRFGLPYPWEGWNRYTEGIDRKSVV